MIFLENFYLKTIKYDLVNKFIYKKTKHLPAIKKIILDFRCDKNNLKDLSMTLMALKLVTNQKSKITTANHSNIYLKIRKGNPVGCKVTLRQNIMFQFIIKILIDAFPKIKNFTGLKLNKTYQYNTFSYSIKDFFVFSELGNYYHLFNNLPKLKITFVTNTKTHYELIFLLLSFKLPIK